VADSNVYYVQRDNNVNYIQELTMTTITITEVRPQLRKLADRVCHHGERICVERNGEPVFVMVSFEDFEAIEAFEEKIDIHEATKALRKGKFIPLEKLEAELGL